MTAQTKEFLSQFFKSDPTITPDAAKMCFMILSGSPDAVRAREVTQRVVSREEAAKMMGIGPKRVDDFSRRGILRRVYYPGNSRASGILISSVEDAIARGIG